MGKIFIGGCLVLVLLLASPAMAQDGSAKGKNVPAEKTPLAFGGDTGHGPNTFFFETLGYGGDTGEGPSTFLFEALGWQSNDESAKASSSWRTILRFIRGVVIGSQPSGI